MKKIIEIWKEGWIVLGRVFLFGLILNIICIPLSLLSIIYPGSKEHAVFDDNGFHIIALFIWLALLFTLPFIFYFASRISGEFVAPRKWKKKNE
jgi:hypothetical protein